MTTDVDQGYFAWSQEELTQRDASTVFLIFLYFFFSDVILKILLLSDENFLPKKGSVHLFHNFYI